MAISQATCKVSYVVATKDRPEALDKMLTNVRMFIRPQDEVVIWEGGDPEKTRPIVQKHGDIVKVWQHGRDHGSAEGFNRAILLSSGEIIVNLNDDDYFFPEGVKRAVEVMESDPAIDALVCGGVCSREDPTTPDGFQNYKYQRVPEGQSFENNWRLIMHECSAGFLLVRRLVHIRLGIYNTIDKANDTEFMSRLVRSGVNFRYLDVKYFRHVERSVSAQVLYTDKAMEDRVRIALRHEGWRDAMMYPAACAKVLGLNQVPGGQDLFLVIRFAEELRARCRPVLWAVARVLRLIEKVALGVHRGLRKKQSTPAEPGWDGRVR